MKQPSLKPSVILITDGRTNVSLGGDLRQEIMYLCKKLSESNTQLTVIDFSSDPFAPNYIRDIIEAADAKHLEIEELTSIGF